MPEIDLESVKARHEFARMAGIAADDAGQGWDGPKLRALVASWQYVAALHDEVRRLRTAGDEANRPPDTSFTDLQASFRRVVRDRDEALRNSGRLVVERDEALAAKKRIVDMHNREVGRLIKERDKAETERDEALRGRADEGYWPRRAASLTADIAALADETARLRQQRDAYRKELERYDGQAWDDLLAERDRLRQQVGARDDVVEAAKAWRRSSTDKTVHALVSAVDALPQGPAAPPGSPLPPAQPSDTDPSTGGPGAQGEAQGALGLGPVITGVLAALGGRDMCAQLASGPSLGRCDRDAGHDGDHAAGGHTWATTVPESPTDLIAKSGYTFAELFPNGIAPGTHHAYITGRGIICVSCGMTNGMFTEGGWRCDRCTTTAPVHGLPTDGKPPADPTWLGEAIEAAAEAVARRRNPEHAALTVDRDIIVMPAEYSDCHDLAWAAIRAALPLIAQGVLREAADELIDIGFPTSFDMIRWLRERAARQVTG